MKRLMQKSFLLSMSIAVLFTLAGILGRTLFPAAFGTAPETPALIETGLVIYSAGFVFTGVVRLLSAYFYACAHTGVSTLLIYADPDVYKRQASGRKTDKGRDAQCLLISMPMRTNINIPPSPANRSLQRRRKS